jgi:hypothetical protein
MKQLDFQFNENTNTTTICIECLYLKDCTDEEKQNNKANNECSCEKYKWNDLPF